MDFSALLNRFTAAVESGDGYRLAAIFVADGAFKAGAANPLDTAEAAAIVINTVLYFVVYGVPSGLVMRKIGRHFYAGLLLAITPTATTSAIVLASKFGYATLPLYLALLIALYLQVALLIYGFPSYIEAPKGTIIWLSGALTLPVLSPLFSLFWLIASIGKPHLRGVKIRTPSRPLALRQNFTLILIHGGAIALLILIAWHGSWQIWTAIMAISTLAWLWLYIRNRE